MGDGRRRKSEAACWILLGDRKRGVCSCRERFREKDGEWCKQMSIRCLLHDDEQEVRGCDLQAFQRMEVLTRHWAPSPGAVRRIGMPNPQSHQKVNKPPPPTEPFEKKEFSEHRPQAWDVGKNAVSVPPERVLLTAFPAIHNPKAITRPRVLLWTCRRHQQTVESLVIGVLPRQGDP
jgi:hypothetical protein